MQSWWLFVVREDFVPQVLSYAFALSPSLLQQVQQKPLWSTFVTDILLRVKTRCDWLVDAFSVICMSSKYGLY